MIYNFTLPSNIDVAGRYGNYNKTRISLTLHFPIPSLLHISHQLRTEAIDLYYSTTTFLFKRINYYHDSGPKHTDFGPSTAKLPLLRHFKIYGMSSFVTIDLTKPTMAEIVTQQHDPSACVYCRYGRAKDMEFCGILLKRRLGLSKQMIERAISARREELGLDGNGIAVLLRA